MNKRAIPFPALGRLLLLAALFVPGFAAGAATARGQASAVISSGVALRTAPDLRGLRVETDGRATQIQAPRSVTRPCQPNTPADAAQCRFILVDMQ